MVTLSLSIYLINRVKSEMSIQELPITFVEREFGKSKMDFHVIFEGVRTLLKLYLNK